MKKFLLLILALTFFLTGCGVKETEFKGGGVTVTLTSDFKEYESDNWNYYLENKDVAFMTKRVNFQSTIGEVNLSKLTLNDYLNLVLSTNNIKADTYIVEGINGTFYYCFYTSYKDYNDNYAYMLMVMKGKEHFYNMNFCCDYDDREVYQQQFLQYAVTISVI